MDTLDFLKWLVKARDERAILLADALLGFAESEKLKLPDWVSALAAMTDPKYIEVIDDLIRAEEELS